MIIFIQDIIFMLKLDIEMLNKNVRVNVIKMSNFLKKYDLNIILHILT